MVFFENTPLFVWIKIDILTYWLYIICFSSET